MSLLLPFPPLAGIGRQFVTQVIFDKLMVFVAKLATPVMLAEEEAMHWLDPTRVDEARVNCLEAQQVLVAQA